MRQSNFKTEEEFNDYVLDELKKLLKQELNKYHLKIDKHKKIMKDVTIIPTRLNDYVLGFGFSDVDIVIYKESKYDYINELKKVKGLRLESLRKETKLIVPFVIVELKLKNVTSHAMIVYSHTTAEIKDKFPFCMFNMIIYKSNKKDITILRQAKNFDRVLSLYKQFSRKGSFMPKDSIKDIVKPISLHLEKLAEREFI